MSIWVWASLAAAAYCLTRGILDLRRRSYAWGLFGIASAFVIISTPYPTHAISIRLPVGASKVVH